MDYGAIYTENQIKKLEHEIHIVYNQAEIDIRHKMEDFNKKYRAKEKIYAKELRDGKITQEQFDNWKKGQVFQGEQWKAKREQILNTMHNSNKIAADIVNGKMNNVFMVNANYANYDIEHKAKVNFGFGIYDSATVAKLIKDNPQVLPKWKINEPKDYTWSQKKVNRSITQGIIQGESLDKIAKRLTNKLVTNNENKMKTFARTAMTEAQNAGRLESMKSAKDLGIDLYKEWMATLDSHTRDSHAAIDGEKVPIDSKFSNGLKYPGDPGGAPAEIYNCRCTMVSDIRNYPSYYERYDNIKGKPIAGMTYKEWKRAKTMGGNLNRNNLVYNSTFKVKTENGTHWIKLTKDYNHKFVDQTRDADVFTLDDDIQIVYPYDLDESKQTLKYDDIIKQMYKIPPDFRSVMQQEIQVVDFENPDDPYWRTKYKNFSKSYATGGEKIVFYANTDHDMNYVKDALCHEGGHYLDRYVAYDKTTGTRFSALTEWADATAADLALIGFDSVTPYGSNAMTEDFAESCMMLFSRDPNLMQKQFPNRTKILKRLVKQYGKR